MNNKNYETVMLSTDEPSQIFTNTTGDPLGYCEECEDGIGNQFVYVLSDETIKHSEWCIYTELNLLRKALKFLPTKDQHKELGDNWFILGGKGHLKIVATNDPSLYNEVNDTYKLSNSFLKLYVEKQGKVSLEDIQNGLTLQELKGLAPVVPPNKEISQEPPTLEEQKEEFEKCIASPYYFYTQYMANGDWGDYDEVEFNNLFN